jgi:hypothetical protein
MAALASNFNPLESFDLHRYFGPGVATLRRTKHAEDGLM